MGAANFVPYKRLKSEPVAWSASSQDVFKLSFFKPAFAMSAPMIDRLTIRIAANVDGDGNSGKDTPGHALTQVLANLLLADSGGEREHLSGLSKYILNRIEYGAQAVRMPDIVKTASGLNVVGYLDIFRTPRRAARPSDFRINLYELLDGGEFELTFGPQYVGPAQGNGRMKINSATLELYARVVDEKVHEDKTRMLNKETNISSTEADYSTGTGPTAPLVRHAIAFCGPTDFEAGTPWNSQKVSSEDLAINNRQDDYLAHEMSDDSDDFQSDPVTSPSDHGDDPIRKGFAIPLQLAPLDASMTELPATYQVQYKTDLAQASLPTNPVMLLSSIVDRTGGPCNCSCEGDKPTGVPKYKMADGALRDAIKSDVLKRKLPISYR